MDSSGLLINSTSIDAGGTASHDELVRRVANILWVESLLLHHLFDDRPLGSDRLDRSHLVEKVFHLVDVASHSGHMLLEHFGRRPVPGELARLLGLRHVVTCRARRLDSRQHPRL